MAISPNCLLTTPLLAPVTSSLFCPPQQHSLSSLGRGQRRLCQPRAARPTRARPRTHHGHGTEQVPACLHTFGAAKLTVETPLLEKDLPITQGSDDVSLLHSQTDYLEHLGKGEKVFLESQNA